MAVANIMTKTPTCCTPNSSITEVARMMIDNDCGQIPSIKDFTSNKLAGVITDRDIATRIVAKGYNSAEAKACDCMTTPCIPVASDSSLKSCRDKIRCVPVGDDKDSVVGIFTLANLVRNGSVKTSVAVLKQVSTDL